MTSQQAFGDALRRHREQRGITLETISNLTKINASLLAALERGDCSRWPGGIYSRAYIKDYAQAIGLDRDEAAARFTACFSETAFPEGAAKPASDPSTPRAVTCPPLRMTFEERPSHRLYVFGRRALVVLLDLILTVSLATIVAVATPVGFWMALGGVSVCCQLAAVLRTGTATWSVRALVVRHPAGRSTAPAADRALAEAA